MRTLSELRQGLRDLISEPQNAGQWTTAFLNRQLNRSLRKFALKILNKFPHFYYSTDEISTTDGIYLYSVPTDYWKTLGVKNSDGIYLNVEDVERFGNADDTDQEDADATHYGRVGNYIWLHPTPSATGTIYTHEYYKFPSDMSSDSGSPDFPQGHEDILEMDAAIRCGVADGAELQYMYAAYRETVQDLWEALESWQTFQQSRVKFTERYFGKNWINTNTRR